MLVGFDDLAMLIASCFAVGFGGAALQRRIGRRERESPARRDWNIVFAVASSYAAGRGHDHLTPEHFVLAALCNDGIADRHVGSSAGVALLRETIMGRLAKLPCQPRPLDSCALAPSMAAALRRAKEGATALGRPDITIDDLMTELASTDAYEVSTLLAEARAQRDPPPPPPSSKPLLNDPYRSGAAEPLLPIVFWNDASTTMMTLVEILRDVFHKPETEAMTLMLTVHVRGHAIVGRYAASDATKLVDAGTSRARRSGEPLRITIGEPAP